MIVDQDEHREREEDNNDRQPLCGENEPILILSNHISKPLTPADREGDRQGSADCQNKCSD